MIEPRLVPVLLYGSLRKKFGHRFELAVSSPAHAMRHLMAVLPGFKQFLHQHDKPGFHVLVGAEDQNEETLENPSGNQVIRIIPAVAGAGGKGLFQTIFGAALIALSFVPAFAPFAGAMMKIGIAMALGGVSQMMASSPRRNSAKEADDPGHSFNGTDNVIAQGQVIPVAYGRVRVGSLVVSCGTSAESNFPSGAGGGPFGANEGTWAQMSSVGGVSAWFNGGDGDTVPFVWNVDPA